MKKQILLTATAISLAISSSLALAAPVELIVEETTTQVRKAKVNFGNARIQLRSAPLAH